MQLVKELRELGYLRDHRVEEAFASVDRKLFVPNEYEEFAYENRPFLIGHKQTISQPLVVAFMLELLDVHPGEKILEIGTGSGWQTALLAYVAHEEGKIVYDHPLIVSLEIIPELLAQAKENLLAVRAYKEGMIQLEERDGSKGYEKGAPFDKIIVSASADKVPETWKNQLKIGGKIVAPIRQSIVMIEKRGKNEFDTKEFFGFSFVPLVSK